MDQPTRLRLASVGSIFPAEISLSAIDTDEGILITAAVRGATKRLESLPPQGAQLSLAQGPAPGPPVVHPGRAAGGLWLWKVLVPSGLRAVVVPSGCRATVQPHWWIATWW
ncbi:MAG TPA: hypothetical protein VK284_14710, partial [Streptosporangiaceae bacterium]|nr:hypothetical protein [Streptosporangiaceae bacterium]